MTAEPRVLRHTWEHRSEHSKVCTRCGTRAQQRPHPYEQRWFTEWRRPDGSYTDSMDGGRTPPCAPAAESAATAGEEQER